MSFHTPDEIRVQSSLISLPRAYGAGVDEVPRIDRKLRQNDVQDKEKQKKAKKNVENRGFWLRVRARTHDLSHAKRSLYPDSVAFQQILS